jgi:hypothetical protein
MKHLYLPLYSSNWDIIKFHVYLWIRIDKKSSPNLFKYIVHEKERKLIFLENGKRKKKMKEAVTGWLASVFSSITGYKSIRGYLDFKVGWRYLFGSGEAHTLHSFGLQTPPMNRLNQPTSWKVTDGHTDGRTKCGQYAKKRNYLQALSHRKTTRATPAFF